MQGESTAALLGSLLAALVLVGSAACSTSPEGNAEGQTTTTSSSGADTSETVADTSTQESTDSTGEGEETEDSTNPSGSFYAPAQDFISVTSCDPFMQDCPEGEKCVAASSVDNEWAPNENRCVPITGSGEPGDACTFDSWGNPIDDCDGDSFCYPADIESKQGVCAAFCSGDAADPICAPGTECFLAYSSTLSVCLEPCHPLLQDCVDDQICAYDGFETFFCLEPAPLVGQLGDNCGLIASCAEGLCVAAELLNDCAGGECCAEYCDISMPDTPCTNPDYTCTAVFEDGLAPELYTTLGVCVLSL